MHSTARRLLSWLLMALGATQWSAASANHSFCITSSSGVGSSAQLVTALKYATTASDETVYIHLEQGTFTLAGENYYEQDGNGGDANLHVVGGFVPGASCSSRVVNPASTVIKGKNGPAGSFPISRFHVGQEQGELLIDGIQFDSFADGVEVWTSADSTATIRNIIVTNMGNYDGFTLGALDVETHNVTGASSVRVENCLIYGNSSPSGLSIIAQHDGDSTQILNCTIADNSGYGLYLGTQFSPVQGSFKAYNNIIRNNTAADIHALYADNVPTIDRTDVNSVIGTISGPNNFNVDPKFVNEASAEYQLQSDSTLINKGAAASAVAGGYASTDIRGRQRVIGSRVDLGPYETLVDDTAPQSVDLTDDTPTGKTLRAAITTANSNAGPTTITFNIAGSCPQYIELSSLLPNITSDVTIDGYSQPDAAPNSVVPGYNGAICVVLRGGGLDHALQTSGSGRLTVRGIEFEDFSTAAIRLASGSGHIVTGNGFSAFPGETLASKDGVLIEGSATNSQIGSYAFGDRNVFAQSTEAAIKLASNGAGHHLIQGNYIGFDFDGSQWTGAPNKYGIYLQDSGSNEISFNYIGGSQLYALFLTGTNTSANHVIENSIGSAPADGSAAGNGAGSGCLLCFALPAVDLASGAHGNYIGAIGGSGGNNVIVNNYGGGVYVEQGAGIGNRIYGNNVIHDNGGELAIDLGTLGPTINDVGDGDFGGNNLQNYPTLSQATRIEADIVRLSGSLVAQTGVPAGGYRLDVYWTDSCLFNGGGSDTPRGEMKRYVGFLNIYSDGSTFNLPFSNEDTIASRNLPHPTAATPGYLFAIATDSAGNTSEPGPCRTFVDDYIFSNGLE